MAERKYHGHTLKEISDKYYITYHGNEESVELYDINSKLTRYWQEISFFYTDTKRKLAAAKDNLRKLEEQFDLNVSEAKGRLLDENRNLAKTDRLSDKARETLAIRECMTTDMRKEFSDARDDIGLWEEESTIWHEVRQNLRFISDRINNSTMNMGIEAKITKNFKVEASDEDKTPDKNDTTTEDETPMTFTNDSEEMKKEKDKSMKEYCEKHGISNPEEEVPF